MTGMAIRLMTAGDWPEVAAIYAAGIATGNATFETEPPPWARWDAAHRDDLRFVCTDGDRIVGWVAANNVSDRSCYAEVVEHSVYIYPDWQGQGIGRRLLQAPHRSRHRRRHLDYPDWNLPGKRRQRRPPPNLRLSHLGTRDRIGQLHGVWRDVLLLERRSPNP